MGTLTLNSEAGKARGSAKRRIHREPIQRLKFNRFFKDFMSSGINAPSNVDEAEFRNTESIRLGKIVNTGREAKKRLRAIYIITNYPSIKRYLDFEWQEPTKKEIRLLHSSVEKGEEACNQLVRLHLRLIDSVARDSKTHGESMINRYLSDGLDLRDLYLDGYTGLRNGAWNWDYGKGLAFSTFVWGSIWGDMNAGHINERENKIASFCCNEARYLKSALHSINEREKDKGFSTAKYSKRTGLTLGILKDNLKLVKKKGREWTESKIDLLQARAYAFECLLSLNDPVYEDEELELVDTIQGEDGSEIINKIVSELVRKRILQAIETLNPNEKQIILGRYMSNGDGKLKSQEEVGKKFNISRQRVHQIERRALGKLAEELKDLAKVLCINKGERIIRHAKHKVSNLSKIEKEHIICTLLENNGMPPWVIESAKKAVSHNGNSLEHFEENITHLEVEGLLPFASVVGFLANFSTTYGHRELEVIKRKKKEFQDALLGA